MVAFFLIPLFTLANEQYLFEEISCASASEALTLTPQIFSSVGIHPSFFTNSSVQAQSISFLLNDHDTELSMILEEPPTDTLIETLFPNHVRSETEKGWFILDTNRVLFAEKQGSSLSIYTNAPLSKRLAAPSKGCIIETNRRFPPYLNTFQQKRLELTPESTIIDVTHPILSIQREPHALLSHAKYASRPKPLNISLSYAPLIVQLNFSPMYWMYHSAFPLMEEEHKQLLEADPFASGTLVVFDIQHGAPEPYPSLIAIPFKGFWTPKKHAVDEKIRQLFRIAKFDYRKGEFGYRWREWEIVPVDGGMIISKSNSMLKEALSSLEDSNTWEMLSSLQKDFLASKLIGMHYNLEQAQEQKKIRTQNLLPNQLSLTLKPTSSGWSIQARSDLKGAQALIPMLANIWQIDTSVSKPLHPIAKDILSIAGRILAEGVRPSSYITNQDLLERKWISKRDGLFSVHPTATSMEIHYCSKPKTEEALHFTWIQGVLYQNPKPCDL